MMTCRPNASFGATFATFPEVERLMGAFAAPARQPQEFHPPVNVWEDAAALHIESELPGYTLANLDITTLGDELTIAGSREEATPGHSAYLRRERGGAAQFKRTLRIGIPFDAEKVSASLKNGVLTVTLPKVEPVKARKIEVRPA